MIKIGLPISVLAVLAALAVAGCGNSSSSSSGPASLASPGSLVYVEGNLKPTGELKSNVDATAKTIAGIDNLGDYVVSELESSAGEGEPVDFAKEIEPWLGETAGVAFERLENGELSDPLIAIQTTDTEATQTFIDKQSSRSQDASKDLSYEGVDFKLGGSEENAIGVVGEWLVIAAGDKAFKAAVDASDGDSLADEDRFQTAFDAASDGSLADIYVDVGGVIEQSEKKIDPQAKAVLQSSGIDPSKATAVASVIPGSDQIEVDLSSDLGGEKPPRGDASKLLGTMPAESVAAFAVSDFGAQFKKVIDNLDKTGIPPKLPPRSLKSILSQAGIDLDKVATSLEDAAAFVEGDSRSTLGGAMVVTGKDDEAAEAVANLGKLLPLVKVPGVAAVNGRASGFLIHSPELGGKAIVVVGKDGRIVVGYGLAGAGRGLEAGSGPILSDSPTYKAAVASLGDRPISAFVDGASALRLAEALVPRSKTDFWEAVPYLKKIEYLALGAGDDVEELATAKLIAGLGK